MRKDIHPEYTDTVMKCSCGSVFTTRSTAGGELHVELCSECHPYYTGQQKFVDTGGRVQRFSDKFGDAAAATLERANAAKAARQAAAEAEAEGARKAREAREAAKAERRAKVAPVRAAEEATEVAAAEELHEEAVAEAVAAEVLEADA